MTNQKIIDLFKSLSGIAGLKGVKFNYAIAKNINLLNVEVENLQKSIDPSDEYKKYDIERIELVKKYAKKDEKGEPIIQDNQYILEDQKAFDVDFALLKQEHQEVIDARQKQIDDFNEFLKKESTVSLYKIKFEDISPDITTEQMVGIYPLIEE